MAHWLYVANKWYPRTPYQWVAECEDHRTPPFAVWHSCSVFACGRAMWWPSRRADCLMFSHRRQRGLLGGQRLAGAPGVL